MGCTKHCVVLQTVFAFEEASVVRADVRRERVLPEAHLAELVRRHAVAPQGQDNFVKLPPPASRGRARRQVMVLLRCLDVTKNA